MRPALWAELLEHPDARAHFEAQIRPQVANEVLEEMRTAMASEESIAESDAAPSSATASEPTRASAGAFVGGGLGSAQLVRWRSELDEVVDVNAPSLQMFDEDSSFDMDDSLADGEEAAAGGGGGARRSDLASSVAAAAAVEREMSIVLECEDSASRVRLLRVSAVSSWKTTVDALLEDSSADAPLNGDAIAALCDQIDEGLGAAQTEAEAGASATVDVGGDDASTAAALEELRARHIANQASEAEAHASAAHAWTARLRALPAADGTPGDARAAVDDVRAEMSTWLSNRQARGARRLRREALVARWRSELQKHAPTLDGSSPFDQLRAAIFSVHKEISEELGALPLSPLDNGDAVRATPALASGSWSTVLPEVVQRVSADLKAPLAGEGGVPPPPPSPAAGAPASLASPAGSVRTRRGGMVQRSPSAFNAAASMATGSQYGGSRAGGLGGGAQQNFGAGAQAIAARERAQQNFDSASARATAAEAAATAAEEASTKAAEKQRAAAAEVAEVQRDVAALVAKEEKLEAEKKVRYGRRQAQQRRAVRPPALHSVLPFADPLPLLTLPPLARYPPPSCFPRQSHEREAEHRHAQRFVSTAGANDAGNPAAWMVQRRKEADDAGEAAARAATALRAAIEERSRLETRLKGVRREVEAARAAAIAAETAARSALMDAAGAQKVLRKSEVDLAAATATTSNALEGIEGGLDMFDSPALAAMRQALAVESARATAEQREREALQAQLEAEVDDARDAVHAMERSVAEEVEDSALVVDERDALKAELEELASVDWARALLAQCASLASLRRENAQLLERVAAQSQIVSRGAPGAGAAGATTTLLSGAAYAHAELERTVASKAVEIDALKHRIVDTSRHWANAVHVAREHEEKMVLAVEAQREQRTAWSAERHRLKDFVRSRDRAITRLRHDLALLASVGSSSKEKAAKLLVAELARTDSRIRKLVAARTERTRHEKGRGKGAPLGAGRARAKGSGLADEEQGAAAPGEAGPETNLNAGLKQRMLALRGGDPGSPGGGGGGGELVIANLERRADAEAERAEVLQHQLDTVAMGVARSAGQIAEQHALIASLQTRLACGGGNGARGSISVWA